MCSWPGSGSAQFAAKRKRAELVNSQLLQARTSDGSAASDPVADAVAPVAGFARAAPIKEGVLHTTIQLAPSFLLPLPLHAFNQGLMMHPRCSLPNIHRQIIHKLLGCLRGNHGVNDFKRVHGKAISMQRSCRGTGQGGMSTPSGALAQ